MTNSDKVVTPVQAGVQGHFNCSLPLDSGWSLPRKALIRGRNDEDLGIPACCMVIT
jgi:hypothetical protein